MGGWVTIFAAAYAMIRAQAIQYEVASWMIIAFVVVMFFEGVRASFFRRHHYD